ncbi:bifunctional oligoribonuclease/PAP phosphatase NrnA [Hydrogenimonas sp.]|uniref:DHH family phosphoesterase n=1 Tax=Hydrogenimonas sp. TaxID=2231112 RepID=UPI0026186AFB|nr:bifunctional oligoribonuclease/PAP phosphatase NrnA [Hydrogenimonas sp.]
MDYRRAREAIENARYVTIVGHLNPDADTLGTGLGLWWILKEMGKRVDAVYMSHPLPQMLSFLPAFGKIKHAVDARSDLILSVDCGSFDRLGIERPEKAVVVNIDHHRSNTAYGDIDLVEPDYSCAAEVAFRLALSAGWDIPRSAAINFYTALISDTGYFGYEGVNARVFDFAKALLQLGADAEWSARMLRENQPLCKMRLLPKVLETLTLHLQGRAAGLHVTRRMLESAGATVNETDDMVNYARALATVEVGFLIREEEAGGLKVSLRSKSKADVGRIAVAFGGGGHIRAAGFTVYGMEHDMLVEKLLYMIKEEIEA